jgi:hypothetical protein
MPGNEPTSNEPNMMRDLRGGKFADTMEIARRFRLSDAHVRRILRFGYLAPDIVEAIVEGRQPQTLTVKRLLPRPDQPCCRICYPGRFWEATWSFIRFRRSAL